MKPQPYPEMTPDVLERFEGKFEKAGPDDCWIWTGATVPTGGEGYGVLRVNKRNLYVHRLSYAHYVGPIPEGLELDHLCRRKPCVNPAHLEVVTQLENTTRAKRDTNPTHCKKCGMEFTPENTYIEPSSGWRRCKNCMRIKQEKWRAENPDYHREYMKKWNEENPEKKKAADKKYADANREKRLAYWREYYARKKREGRG